ncbi:hypothetical protein OHQ89_07855 [Streptomyces canus]|uniref:DUF7737 domain-containing protein n=1 Tax=Streptomyces canus TaxID=58343 RepID=UPI0030E53812
MLHNTGFEIEVPYTELPRLSACTPGACRRMFEVLVERSEERGWVDLTRGVQALDQCTGPLPDVSARSGPWSRPSWPRTGTQRRPRADPAPAEDRRAVLARRLPPRRTRRLADVQDPSGPFEDDRLSVILSKAFLLAHDTKITDPTILAQLGRRA